ncbi:MAG: hypothetical protein KGK08_06340 [Acidobacteriota bacterium]|nr:hypothetical protein [Acidobacteriota bacterium]
MDIQLALSDLDKHASEFNFPVLDNAYVDMAAARLTAFRGVMDWAIAFEVLGYSINEGTFVNDLYAFGSSLLKEGFVSSTPIMSSAPSSPLIDQETGAWIADWEQWRVIIKGKSYEFTPAREEYLSQGLHVPIKGGAGSLRESQVLRFFVCRKGTGELFMKEDELRGELRLDPQMIVFLQTEQWQHPDVAGEEKPSENVSICSLLKALDLNSPAVFQKGFSNTHWRHWDSSTHTD